MTLLRSTQTWTTSLALFIHLINGDAGVQVSTLVTPKPSVLWIRYKYICVVPAILLSWICKHTVSSLKHISLCSGVPCYTRREERQIYCLRWFLANVSISSPWHISCHRHIHNYCSSLFWKDLFAFPDTWGGLCSPVHYASHCLLQHEVWDCLMT